MIALYMLSAMTNAGYNKVINGKGNLTYNKIQQIKYSFQDASVPPEYHRSYTITVTSDKVRIVVDSYGDILADETRDITNKQFVEIKCSLKENEIKICTLGESEGCTGGTTEKVSCTDGKKEIFSGFVYHCGGKDTGNLGGDITHFAKDVKNLIVNLQELLTPK